MSSRPAEKTVVIVDKDELLFRFLRFHFGRDGFRAVFAGDGSQLDRLIAKEKPVAVMLELVLPGASGFEILERHKERPPFIVVLSQLSQPEDREKAVRVGADLYFSKHDSTIRRVVDETVAFLNRQ
ncbi:MAG: response regulator [bacterium]